MSAATRQRATAWITACLLALAPLLATAATAGAGPDAAAYQRSLELPRQWRHLTRGIAGPVTWIDDARYRYRRTTAGGFEFVVRAVGDDQARPAFDHARLAAALGGVLDAPQEPLRLPFEDYEFDGNEDVIRFRVDGQRIRCELGAAVRCAAHAGEPPRRRPRAFGVVRDLTVPANDAPRPSTDGRHAA